MDDAFDIALVGAGLDPKSHLTPEACHTIGTADYVYHLTSDHFFICEIAGGSCEDLAPLYRSVSDSSVYETICDKVIEKSEEGSVAFVTYGHPMVLVDSNQSILTKARERNLKVVIVSGVSSLDIMLERLTLDVGLAGMMVLEANQMVALSHHPIPTMSCFILQVGAFGSSKLTVDRKNHPKRFERLQSFLLQSYDRYHPGVLITCAHHPLRDDIILQVPLGELSNAYKSIHTGMSLYIPPSSARNVDTAFLDSLRQSTNVFADSQKTE